MTSLLIFILRGLPGAGKTTIMAQLCRELGIPFSPSYVAIFSADDFFMEDGVYKFDAKKLPEAHGQCLREFINQCRYEQEDCNPSAQVLFVDNTNLSVAEFSPYMAVASAYGYEPEIVTLECPVEKAAARNTHGVPADRYPAMKARMDEGTKGIAPWQKHRIIET